MRGLRGLNSRGNLSKRKILLSGSATNGMSSDGALALESGCLNHSVGTADRSAIAPILIRRHPRGRIVNAWLASITVLGGLIVVADGLTRSAKDWDGTLLPPFDYEANPGAILLAAVTLPLMFAYARRARVSFTEGFFLWFTFCTTAYTRDFSYLRLPGTPLFVTDVVLVVLLSSLYILPRVQKPQHPLALNVFLMLFVAAGLVSAARGFGGNDEPTLVLRDYALVVYAFFLLIGYQLFRNWSSIKRLAVWFLLGTALNVLNGAAWFVAAPEQRRFVFPGIYVLVALVVVLMMMANRLIRKKAGWALAVVFFVGLLLANARSLFLSLAIVLLSALLLRGQLRVKVGSVPLIRVLVSVSLLGCALVFLSVHVKAERDFTTRVVEELESGTLHMGEDANWQFRLVAWKEAWRRFEKSPLAGEGFGVPFTFGIWDNDARPHNTFLTVLYKMGLVGFLPLFGLLGYFFWRGLQCMHGNSENRRVVFLQIAILTQLALCLFGSANLLLESPYLASLFWTVMGVGLGMIRRLDLEKLLRNYAACSRTNGALAENEPVGQQLQPSP
jgi:O-antigen ligase